MNALSVGSLSIKTDSSMSSIECKLHMGKLNKCTNSPEPFGPLT